MHVDGVTLGATNPNIVKILNPASSDAADLFNTINPTTSDVSANKPWWAPASNSAVFDAMLSFAIAYYKEDPVEEVFRDPVYNRMWLQYPNEQLQRLADRITKGLSDDDDKVTAIIRWTLYNFPYEYDKKNYGEEEFWAPPTFALAKGSGDCEDGAFLVHSLLLHAGIPYERIRTYGGLVKAGEGAATGGHAWTAYCRKSDDEWVILDSSYYPTLRHVSQRPMMKDDDRYVDNFFWFNQLDWVNTYSIDRIHNPGALAYNARGYLENKIRMAGWLVNNLA